MKLQHVFKLHQKQATTTKTRSLCIL